MFFKEAIGIHAYWSANENYWVLQLIKEILPIPKKYVSFLFIIFLIIFLNNTLNSFLKSTCNHSIKSTCNHSIKSYV